MAKQVIKYESKDGTIFDNEKDANQHDVLYEIYDTANNMLSRYGFDMSDVKTLLTVERENIEAFYKNLDAEKEIEGHPDYVTTSSGNGGYFALYLKWNDEYSIYEPWNTSEPFKSFDYAIRYAKEWAEGEGVEYKEA